jgi:hypothetical protein
MSGGNDAEMAGQLERQAGDENARCQRTSVLASGLAAEIDDVRRGGEDLVVPAPGLETLKLLIGDAAQAAGRWADTIPSVLNDPAAGASDLAWADAQLQVIEAFDQPKSAAAKGDRAARRLAQLGSGRSQPAVTAPTGSSRPA